MANEIYQLPGTAVVWLNTGGDKVLDLGNSVTAGTGRVGAAYDRGTSARPGLYGWQLLNDGFDSAPVVGAVVELWIAESDGTRTHGPVAFSTSADAALASLNLLPNLGAPVGLATVRSTTAGDDLVVGGRIVLTDRYVIPVVVNRTAVTLLSTADAHRFAIWPLPDQIQAA